MNKQRRRSLEKLIPAIEALAGDVRGIQEEETEAFENMPEGIQMSDRGDTMQNGIDALGLVADTIEEQVEAINEIVAGGF